MATKTAAAPKSTAAPKAAAAPVASQFAGLTVFELIALGTPGAIDAAKKLTAGNGLTNDVLSNGNEWGQGVPYGTYSDVYGADKKHETFMNKKGDKVSGRIVKDASGRRVKLYNSYLRLLPETGKGAPIYNADLNMVLFDKVQFGVMASPDADNRSEYTGADGIARMYAGTVHSYQAKTFTNPPAVAPIVKKEEE